MKSNIRKQLVPLLLATLLATSIPTFASTLYGQVTDIKLMVNNQNIKSDVVIFNAQSYLSVREVAQALNLSVEWNEKERAIYLSSKETQNESTHRTARELGNCPVQYSDIKLYLNGEQLKKDVLIVGGDTSYLPVRALVEELWLNVSWNEAERKIALGESDSSNTLPVFEKDAALNEFLNLAKDKNKVAKDSRVLHEVRLNYYYDYVKDGLLSVYDFGCIAHCDAENNQKIMVVEIFKSTNMDFAGYDIGSKISKSEAAGLENLLKTNYSYDFKINVNEYSNTIQSICITDNPDIYKRLVVQNGVLYEDMYLVWSMNESGVQKFNTYD